MAKLNPHELFIKTFRAFNLERYKDSRVDKPRFQGLQLSEVVFDTFSPGADNKVVISTITSESRRFIANEQSFVKAHIGDAGISNVLSLDYPYEDVVTMKALSEPGLTAYMNEDLTKVLFAVVYPESVASMEISDILPEVQSILTAACNYDIGAQNITVTQGTEMGTHIAHVQCDTIYADILVVRSELPTLLIPTTDYGPLAEEVSVPNPYPPVPDPQ